jgi:serine carboxypeptidase-like clade 2
VNCVAEANMLYLETPIGVGFSYAKGSSAYTTTVNDEETGILNIHYYIFLVLKMFLFRNFL